MKYTLLSLMDQDYPAFRIYLSLSKEPYLIDSGVKVLPPWLNDMVSIGKLEVYWVKNTGPYRKLLPIINQVEDDDLLVTCDDDVIYGRGWLSSLIESATEYPKHVVCGRGRTVKKSIFSSRPQTYLHWPLAHGGATGFDIVPTGVGGVVYNKNLLDMDFINKKEFMDLAPRQDDLWFNKARELLNTPVHISEKAGSFLFPINAPGALFDNNAFSKKSSKRFRIISALQEKAQGLAGRLGLPICSNDVAYSNINRYVKKRGSQI
ncbi:glycosyltransferase family A protein [Marinobacterium mangrovicola]|uniref:glycosyltransferase family A protein n=1 Tax=Marinobacterium mangrovicola TaxID=1476959 RepID=UPI001404E495|nr:glycosyltransferase family A protein [Marinobacterium mangrovicola]